MESTRTLQEQRPLTTGLDGIALSYSRLPKHEMTPAHLEHIAAARNVLWGAVETYRDQMDFINAQPRISRYKQQQASEDFNKVVEKARHLDFPSAALKPISFEFIDVSLDHARNFTPDVRKAVETMGFAIADATLQDDKVDYIIQQHFDTIETSQVRPLSDVQKQRLAMTERLLKEHGVTIDVERVPSVVNTITDFTKEHARSVALTGAAALISTSILAPSIANAGEVPAATINISSHSTNKKTTDGLIIGVPESEGGTPSPIVISSPPETPTLPLGQVEVTVNNDTQTNKNKSTQTITLSPDVQAVKSTEPLPVTVNTTKEAPAAPVTLSPTPDLPTNPQVDTSIDVDKIAVPMDSEQTNDETDTPSTITIVNGSENNTPQLDKKTATKEQLAVETITNTINDDGDIATAATLILHSFRNKDEVVTSYKSGQPVYDITNPELVKNIVAQELAFETLISNGGHTDPNYVNTALTALAVFDAASNDQSVLASPDVQKLIAGAIRPTDEYQGKLFDQYAARSKEMLEANGGALLAGINEQYRAQVETMYAYVLLAGATDTEQAAQIQVIKNDEAAVAAAAAAAAAAEAAKNGNYATTPEADAIKNLIDHETDPAKKRTYTVFSYLMTNGGLTATEATGVIGNLLVESAGTMDPSIHQRGGPAQGIAQWEGGRLTNLMNYAASKGKPWDDLYTQLDFLISELAGRQNTLERIKGTTTVFDATNQFMIHFETPNVVVQAQKTGNWSLADAQAKIRANRGQPFLDAYNGAIKSVNDTRAAAAAAEAERQAKMGMNLEQAKAFVASYKSNPDSIKYIGESGTGCNGGPLSNCTSFSVYFVNKFTKLGGMVTQMPGNGSTVVANILARNPGLETGHIPRPDAIFSTPSGSQMCGAVKCGHTGVILGVDEARGVVIVGEAGCGAASVWDTAREYPLAQFSSNAYTYAYTDKYLTTAVK